jgi:hypothetical protein
LPVGDETLTAGPSPAKELPAGIHYTHTAFGVYSIITTEDGRTVPGYAMYNLYQREGQPHISDLVTDFPADFFASVQEMKAGIVIPTPVMQRRLLNIINSELYQALHARPLLIPTHWPIRIVLSMCYTNPRKSSVEVPACKQVTAKKSPRYLFVIGIRCD